MSADAGGLLAPIAPSLIFRREFGNYPIRAYPGGKIKEGVSFDQVKAILGTAYERSKRDERESICEAEGVDLRFP